MTEQNDDTTERPKRRVSERAFSAIMTALLLLPMVGFASLVVDVGYWYDRASEVQKAADAAALAGVVHLPDSAAATSVALETAKRNGYEHGVDGVSILVEPVAGSDTRLQVTITDTEIPLFFAHLFLDDVDIERAALAEFARSIPMGNPENRLGTDPEEGIANSYYMSISGAREAKKGGDRHSDRKCDSTTALCTNGDNGNLVVNGGEYREEGYLFALRVHAKQAGQKLVFEVFDPAHNAASQRCLEPLDSNGNLRVSQNTLPVAYFSSGDASALETGGLSTMFDDDDTNNDGSFLDEWEARYANQPGAIYCTGDSGGHSSTAQLTTFLVRKPDTSPWNNLDNEVIEVDGVCAPQQYSGWYKGRVEASLGDFSGDASFYSMLEAVGDPDPDIAADAAEFASQFRRWVQLCEIPAAQVQEGEYIIQIRTNAADGASKDYDAGVLGSGRNHFSLRGGWDGDNNPLTAPTGAGIELFALGAMAIDTNVPQALVELSLARVTEEYEGQTLEIELWDVGDASADGILTLIPPPDAGAGVQFANCRFENTYSSWIGDPDTTDCSVPISYDENNGNLLTILVEVPPGYTCDSANPAGCFIRVEIDYRSDDVNATVYDHTTWSAGLANDPLRLLE